MPGHPAAPDSDPHLAVLLSAAPYPTLVPESSDFLDAEGSAADKVEAIWPRSLEARRGDRSATAGAMVPWA